MFSEMHGNQANDLHCSVATMVLHVSYRWCTVLPCKQKKPPSLRPVKYKSLPLPTGDVGSGVT